MTAAKDSYYGDPNNCPSRPEFRGANVPKSLRQRPNWVGWGYRWKDGRWTKMPLNPHSGMKRPAKSNDPSTWADIETTVNALNARAHVLLSTAIGVAGGHAVAGPGYMFDGTGEFGLDLDGCRNPETSELTELTSRIIREFGTYAEVSPSGMGVKLFGRGALPWSKGKKTILADGQELELYDRGRYFTVTGLRTDGAAEDLVDCQTALDALIAEFFPPEEAIRKHAFATSVTSAVSGSWAPDDRIIELICRRHSALWNGDTSAHGGDDSRADLALCNLITFFVGSPDHNRIDAIFRQSGLYR